MENEEKKRKGLSSEAQMINKINTLEAQIKFATDRYENAMYKISKSDRMESALRFYADAENYLMRGSFKRYNIVSQDGGKRAVEALS